MNQAAFIGHQRTVSASTDGGGGGGGHHGGSLLSSYGSLDIGVNTQAFGQVLDQLMESGILRVISPLPGLPEATRPWAVIDKLGALSILSSVALENLGFLKPFFDHGLSPGKILSSSMGQKSAQH